MPTIPVLFGPVVPREAVLVPVALIAEIPSVPTSKRYISVPSIWMSTVLANKYRVQISLNCDVKSAAFFFGLFGKWFPDTETYFSVRSPRNVLLYHNQ